MITKHGRLIDADELLIYLEKRMDHESHRNHAYLKGVRDCMKDVREQPTAAPERKTGTWINTHISVNGDSDAECDQCGAVVHDNFSTTINFCPNCGSYNGGEKNGNNSD